MNCLLNIGNFLLKNITFVYDQGNLHDGIVLMIEMIEQWMKLYTQWNISEYFGVT